MNTQSLRLGRLLMSLVLAGACMAQPVLAANEPTISVNATGTAPAAPDMAILSMAVTSEAKTARAALDQNNDAMAKVLAAMKGEGIASRDLQTSGFSIRPKMSYPKRNASGQSAKIVGYTVQNTVTVRVRQLASVGKLLDKAVTLGVNQGGNITFTNDKPEKFLSKARTTAMKNAIAKAQTLVQAAGVKLGRITSISENSRRPGPLPMADVRAMSARSSEAVPVQAGENNYSVTVNVSWEIDQ